MNRFDRQFWRRLWTLAKPYWISDQKRRAVGQLATIIALVLVMVGIGALFSYINRDALNALQARDRAAFWLQLRRFLYASIFFIPMSAYVPWLIGRLTIEWREWMTHGFVGRSFSNRAFYRINSAGSVDNPDQRISEDLNAFTGTTLDFLLNFLNAPVTGITYFVILWTISPKLAVFLLVYALAGTYASVLVGRRLVSINFNQQRYEADFRFGLVHVRDNAEPIAMYGGEAYEQRQLLKRFASVVKNFNLLIRWRRHLAFVTASYNDPVNLLPWFLLAGAYFAGKVELGQLNQAAGAFIALKGAVSIVVNRFNDIANYACVVNRLAEFSEHCEAGISDDGDGTRITSEADSRLELDAVTLMTPDHQRVIVRDLSLKANPNDRIWVRGESGAGKTSLLRAIAGLWTIGHGRIVRPPLAEMMFLPQRPYLVLGSLRDQLCYPRALDASDADLQGALTRANLADLAGRAGGLDAERNWADFLSPGEQQRLAFARLLIHRPAYAFLDEATSALDTANEGALYSQLGELKMAVVSVGHRESLRKFHDRVLELAGDSSWQVIDPEPELPPVPRGSRSVA